MPTIQEQIQIDTTPATAFRYCHDVDTRDRWDERVVDARLLTGKPLRSGSLIRIDAGRSGKLLYSWDAEYVEFNFPSGSLLKVLDAAPSSWFRSGREIWAFEKATQGSGTQFTLTWEYTPRGFLSRIADVIWRRRGTRRAIRQSLDTLKEILEEEA